MGIYDFKVKDKAGQEVSLEKYKGKVVLIVNTATKCGFTPQYEALQALYEKFQDKDFVILDFPCNQFKDQAPGTDEEIASFCNLNYGITFPNFSKIEVNGENAHPLYKYLVAEKGFEGLNEEHELAAIIQGILAEDDPDYKNNPSIKWNFTKFLVDKNGVLLERFEPTQKISVIEEKIKNLL
jgi:glutathione peroxidase